MSSNFSWAPEPQGSGGSGSRGSIVIVLFVLIGVLFAGLVYTFTQIHGAVSTAEQASRRADAGDKDIATLKEQVSKIEGSVKTVSKQTEKTISELQTKVSTVAAPGPGGVGRQSDAVVLKKTAELVEKASAMAKINGDVEQLRTAHSSTESKVGSLEGEVTTVKSDVSSTKTQLQQALADLKSVRGDMGVQSGLIATNAGELAALKQLGDRNYYEFDLKRTNLNQRVGTIFLKLRGIDTKHNRYTVEVIADDNSTLKKDRSVNEPVQFYEAKSRRIPDEIVVNQIGKDHVAGYLATPKFPPR